MGPVLGKTERVLQWRRECIEITQERRTCYISLSSVAVHVSVRESSTCDRKIQKPGWLCGSCVCLWVHAQGAQILVSESVGSQGSWLSKVSYTVNILQTLNWHARKWEIYFSWEARAVDKWQDIFKKSCFQWQFQCSNGTRVPKMPINLWLGWSLASLFLPRLSSLAASHTGSFGTARDKRKRHMIGYDIAFSPLLSICPT